MRPLRYSVTVTIDGCCDHLAALPNEDVHRVAVANLEWADALLLGRITYGMMEAAWRHAPPPGTRPVWMEPFARAIGERPKYVVSRTLPQVDWNAELVQGDLRDRVLALKAQPGNGLLTGGVALPLALSKLGLIDEYEFVVQPRIAGRGPTLLAGLNAPLDLRLVSRTEFPSGIVAKRYVRG